MPPQPWYHVLICTDLRKDPHTACQQHDCPVSGMIIHSGGSLFRDTDARLSFSSNFPFVFFWDRQPVPSRSSASLPAFGLQAEKDVCFPGTRGYAHRLHPLRHSIRLTASAPTFDLQENSMVSSSSVIKMSIFRSPFCRHVEVSLTSFGHQAEEDHVLQVLETPASHRLLPQLVSIDKSPYALIVKAP
jgi:hypothetical protein